MEIINIRHLFSLYWRKIAITVLMVVATLPASAQFNAYNFDMKYKNKPLHFGIGLGYNRSNFKISQSNDFIYSDSIRSIESEKGPGFTIAIISNLRLGNHFDLRLLPTMSFGEKVLNYELFQDTLHRQSIENINLEVPLLLKFRSSPYKDMRMYVIGGAKYSYDLNSNANARNAEELVKVSRHDISVEYGVGMEIYFPMFILAPEVRLSQGIFDIHALDSGLQYSNVLDRLRTRMLVITFNFEG